MLKIASNERRTRLSDAETCLLQRLHASHWTGDELQWLLDHLDESTPTQVIEAIHHKRIELQERQGKGHTS